MANCQILLIAVVGVVVGTGMVSSDNPLSSYEVLFGWKELEYKFLSPQVREKLIENKEFIRENNVITGIKVWGSKVFLTVPRWREGVPATLVYVSLNSTDGPFPRDPLLIPYPSWEMQQVGDCNALQYIQSMEIDQFGRMWALDVGRVNIFREPNNKCPPKLVLIDLKTDEVVRRYEFPESVVSHSSNFLNDIVVGCQDEENKDKCWAYMTDATDSKLVVYNLEENRSWFVHHKSMKADPGATTVPILDGNYTFNTNIDGIALSPRDSNFDRVYFCPLSSYHLYSVSTSVLQQAVNGVTLRDSDVVSHGKRTSQSDGLAMDSQGLLFYGLLANNSVVYFNSTHGSPSKEVLLVQNDVDLQWPDTFAFDDQGYLYMVTNRLQRYSTNTFDYTEVNFRVARVFIGSRSYMYSTKEKVSVPQPAPEDENSRRTSFTNLDQDAPDTPVLVGLDKDSEKYKHEHGNHNEQDQEADMMVEGGGSNAGSNSDNNKLGSGENSHSGHHHHHNHDHSDQESSRSSAPIVNEHVPVVIFLTVLMFNPALNQGN